MIREHGRRAVWFEHFCEDSVARRLPHMVGRSLAGVWFAHEVVGSTSSSLIQYGLHYICNEISSGMLMASGPSSS